ncbi:SPOR domain-containing protein [Calothrix sp. 336/3]|uniref:SPOR domain-containing protein n=1 Tax=Calothrix sp. 336/3 TaxID=1337936 RepID=UPI0004E342D3|nr:hypothetical protein [Calothrix sp. 336/3]AKG22826.1 hypothetical protein IJ00_17475 [Calothrix sp. 336/3]
MSQNPLVGMGVASSNTPALKPVLAAAIASLEVQLDQELTRYRRTRFPSRSPNQFRTEAPSAQAVAVSPPGEISSSQIITTTGMKPPGATTASDHPRNISFTTLGKATNPSPPEVSPLPQNSGSIVPAWQSETAPDAFPETHITPTDNPPQTPDDFLESSEALLRSLTEEQQSKNQKQNTTNDSLLSPLGIGSVLLLLLASLTLGYAIFNPQKLSLHSLKELFQGKSSDSTASNINGNTAQEQLTPMPKYPNLAEQEFPEVRDANDVVGLTPKEKPIAVNTPIPSAPASPSTTTAIKPPEKLPPVNTPIPAAVTPKPAVEVPVAEIKPGADGYFHVVTENQSQQVFAKARQAIADAYVSDDGKLIFLGAVTSKEKAQQLVKELQAKGIKARIQ